MRGARSKLKRLRPISNTRAFDFSQDLFEDQYQNQEGLINRVATTQLATPVVPPVPPVAVQEEEIGPTFQVQVGKDPQWNGRPLFKRSNAKLNLFDS